MKNRYTIGEVAGLLQISAQTLRFYDKIGVVTPAEVDPNTGYRYYSYDQIQYIARIRHLQNFGFQLEAIRDALAANDVHIFSEFLRTRQQEINSEIETMEHTLKELDWYIDYYTHIEQNPLSNVPYMTKEEVRWMLAEPFAPGEDIYGTAGMRLTKLQNTPPFSSLHYRRWNGYLLDYHELLQGNIVPTHYFIYINGTPSFRHQKLIRIPAGRFFTLQSRILSDPLDPELINRFCSSSSDNPLVIANEYEDNFLDFRNCIYEIQISI